MNTNTVNIAFKKDLLSQIDKIAREESRSRSELIREAARLYINRKNTWKKIFEYGTALAKTKNLTDYDIFDEINKYRKSKRK
jgi:metal-responsive CopG/Arc/MetJ family transcriptional regulator